MIAPACFNCHIARCQVELAARVQARHYDWKLRAIKTTLYVAGGMKRAAPDLTEDKARRQFARAV
jgi:Hydrolytic ATP binding site of dynein motor region